MRKFALVVAFLCIAGCGPASTNSEPAKSSGVASTAQLSFDPATLCSALNEAGIVGARWKEGAAGYGCASDELQIGPRDPNTAASSSVWYEVRGTSANSPTIIVLGGDVRVPEAENAVRDKLSQLAQLLLRRLSLPVDEVLMTAIRTNAPFDNRVGNYSIGYSSALAGKIRENRLTIKPAL